MKDLEGISKLTSLAPSLKLEGEKNKISSAIFLYIDGGILTLKLCIKSFAPMIAVRCKMQP